MEKIIAALLIVFGVISALFTFNAARKARLDALDNETGDKSVGNLSAIISCACLAANTLFCICFMEKLLGVSIGVTAVSVMVGASIISYINFLLKQQETELIKELEN